MCVSWELNLQPLPCKRNALPIEIQEPILSTCKNGRFKNNSKIVWLNMHPLVLSKHMEPITAEVHAV